MKSGPNKLSFQKRLDVHRGQCEPTICAQTLSYPSLEARSGELSLTRPDRLGACYSVFLIHFGEKQIALNVLMSNNRQQRNREVSVPFLRPCGISHVLSDLSLQSVEAANGRQWARRATRLGLAYKSRSTT